MDGIIFKNRSEAGRLLGEELRKRKFKNPLILALPRGGVPVGYEAAKILKCPLDTIVARKIGAPMNPEYALGAIAPPDIIIFDNMAMEQLGLTEEGLAPEVEAEKVEMNRRVDLYKSGSFASGEEETVIVVDDGLATGLSAMAALGSARISYRPETLVFAAPVGSPETVRSLSGSADEVVCLSQPQDLSAVGLWYREFPQTTDEEVLRLLEDQNGGKD